MLVMLFCLLVSTYSFSGSNDNQLQQADFIYYVDNKPEYDPLKSLLVFNTAKESTLTEFTPPFNAGNTNQFYWFHTRLKSTAAYPESYRLLTELAYRQLLNAYIVHGQQVTHILEEGVDNVFTDREYPHRWQISSEFELVPGQSVDMLVQYHAMGASFIPLQVVSDKQLTEIIKDDAISAALFYSFSVAAILLFLLFGIAMQDKTSILYAALFSVALLMLAAMEGYGFMYLWPEWPRWNHFSSIVIAYLFCSLGFYVAYKAVEPSQQLQALSSTALTVFKLLAAASLIMVMLVKVLPFIFVVNMTNVFIGIMFVAHAYAIFGWSNVKPGKLMKRNLIAMVSAVLIAITVVLLILLSLNTDILPAFFYVHSSRIVFTLAGLATMATIISHVSGLKKDFENSLMETIEAAKREAEMNRELYESEQKYAKVKALASLRQQQLAEASHDMRQPLVSLRSTIDVITQDQSPKLKQQLANAFSYLENLCNTYLRETRPEQANEAAPEAVPEAAYNEEKTNDPYSVRLVLDTVQKMFESDAAAQGIQLKVQSSTAMIAAEPTIVMRIISNMVSNAVKHARQGTILLGVRRRQYGISIVVADNGTGINTEMMENITQAYKKGPESSGEGLGLAICKQQAEQHQMHLEIDSIEGCGTCCQLHIFNSDRL